LCANIEELRDNREKEVGIAEQIAEMSAVAGLILVLAVNRGEFVRRISTAQIRAIAPMTR